VSQLSSETRGDARNTAMEQEKLLRDFERVARAAPSATALMEHIVARIHETMTRYNWVGFYLVDPHDEGVLIVGPYVGSFTPNARIPLHTGLCGAAARTGQTVIVDDVRKDPRYLAGSSLVVSEIVVPMFVNGRFAAELDVESYFPSTFTKPEQQFVEACAKIVGTCMARKGGI